MMFTKKATVALVIFASMMISGFAHADKKIYGANFCVKRGSGTTGLSHGYNSISNTAAYAITVQCPAINDGYNSSIDTAWIQVKDRHSTANVNCVLGSVSQGTAYTWYASSAAQYSSGSSTYWQQLDFPSMNMYNTFSTPYFSCTIPAISGSDSSMIGNYLLDE